MTDVIRIEFTPMFGEYIRFQISYLVRRAWWLLPFAFLLLVAFVATPLLPLSDKPQSALTTYRNCLGMLILPGIVFVFMPLSMYLSARKRWKASGELRDPRSYEFSTSGISIRATSFESSTAWENIARAETVGPVILLCTAQGSAYLVPAKAFAGDEQFWDFKAMVQRHVRDTKRLK